MAKMTNTNLWWETRYPSKSIEEQQRAIRLWEYLEQSTPPVMYKNIRQDLGLSYWQTVRACGILAEAGVIDITVTADWNGCYYVYPHRVWLKTPVL